MTSFRLIKKFGDSSLLVNQSRREGNMHVYVDRIFNMLHIFGVTMDYYFILVCYKLNRFQTPLNEPVRYVCSVNSEVYNMFTLLDIMLYI